MENEMKNYYKNYLNAHDVALASLEITGRGATVMDQDRGFDQLCAISAQIRDSGHTQYLVGNGASAAFANHMALDWTKNGGVPTHAFANSALLTAMGNDLGFEEAFSAPLSWYAKSGDLLITISSSGNSANIIKTIEVARSKGMGVVTFSGLKPDNKSRQLGDLNFYIPAKTYGIVECAHQVLLHIWLDRYMGIREWDRDDFQDMRKDSFSL
jgi:D-sedoheptulose 7-phosphate isomerase